MTIFILLVNPHSIIRNMAINLTSSNDPIILQTLSNLLNTAAKDVELACSQGKCLKVHRRILTTYSPYFRSRLDACKEPEITICFSGVHVCDRGLTGVHVHM